MYGDRKADISTVLTPKMMQLLLNMLKREENKGIKAGKIRIRFLNNQIHLVIDSRVDWLKARVFSKINFEKDKKKALRKVELIRDIMGEVIEVP